jgi:hypothetical protein
MSKNRSAAGITNIVQYDANKNITFVSGSATLLTVSSSGALTTTGTITAQTLVVQTITSSVNFVTGSTKFGSIVSNTHQFTGSLNVTGSLSVVTTGTEFQVTNTGVNLGNALTDSHIISGSLRVNPNGLFVSSSGFVGIGTTNPQASLHVSGAISEAPSANGVLMGIQSNYAVIHLNGASGTGALIDFSTSGSDYKGRIEYDNNTNFMRFGTDGAERMRITSAGNVGIGTTPSYALDVANSNSPSLRVRNGALGGTSTLLLETANNFSGTCQTFIQCVGSVGNGQSMLLFGTAGNVGDTTATERLRIASTGASTFKVSSDSVFDILTLFNTSQTSAGVRLRFQNGYGDLAGIRVLQMDNGSLADDGQMEFQTAQNASLGTRMTITNAGNIGAPSGTNIYNASDVRLKRNIETITDGLSKVSALRPVKFNWIEGFEPTEENKDMLGFIAQEVQEVVPEAVEQFNNNSITVGDTVIENSLRVNEKFIIPVLVKAIQELKAEIDALKAQ